MSDITNINNETRENADSKGAMGKSSLILNILLVIIGLFFLSKGILEMLTWLKMVPFPDWLNTFYSKLNNTDLTSALSFFGTQGSLSAILGFWACIAGILMFLGQESGWGMAIVILSTISVTSLTSIIMWILNPASFDIVYWPNWIIILSVIIGFFGFFYLLITKKRYT